MSARTTNIEVPDRKGRQNVTGLIDPEKALKLKKSIGRYEQKTYENVRKKIQNRNQEFRQKKDRQTRKNQIKE